MGDVEYALYQALVAKAIAWAVATSFLARLDRSWSGVALMALVLAVWNAIEALTMRFG